MTVKITLEDLTCICESKLKTLVSEYYNKTWKVKCPKCNKEFEIKIKMEKTPTNGSWYH